MKIIIRKISQILVFFIIFGLLPGCLDIYLTTEIHADGSLTKTVVFEGDSSELLDAPFPFVNNPSWEKEWIRLEDNADHDFKMVLSKTFSNSREMSKDLNPNDSIPQFRIEAKLKKRFRWFFTYLDYTETILSVNPYKKVDWKEYFTQDDMDLIIMSEEDREKDPRYVSDDFSSIEENFGKYLFHSGFEDFYSLFIYALQQTPNLQLTLDQVAAKKIEIRDHVTETEGEGISDAEDIIDMLAEFFNADDVHKIYQKNPAIFAHFDAKMDFFDEAADDDYHFTIRMPGLLIGTNSNQIEGNSLSWDFEYFSLLLADYSMTAESRIVNTWAFVVGGIILIILLSLLIWNAFKRRSK